MADAKKGTGSFKEFAKHENEAADKAAHLATAQTAKPAPVVGAPAPKPAPKPDIAPATRTDKNR